MLFFCGTYFNFGSVAGNCIQLLICRGVRQLKQKGACGAHSAASAVAFLKEKAALPAEVRKKTFAMLRCARREVSHFRQYHARVILPAPKEKEGQTENVFSV